jgi:hypothetical protein
LTNGGVASGRSLIGPYENVLEKVYFVQLVNAEHGFRVGLPGHIGERQRRQVALDERNVGGEAGETDQQPVKDLFGIGACRLVGDLQATNGR